MNAHCIRVVGTSIQYRNYLRFFTHLVLRKVFLFRLYVTKSISF